MGKVKSNKGLLIALIIILGWIGTLSSLLIMPLEYSNPWFYLGFFLMVFLYTGLFITAHEAWHKNVSSNSILNESIGKLCCILFVYNNYEKIKAGHYLHHSDCATENDPDFHPSRKFIPWIISFASFYIKPAQFLYMAITTSVLLYFFPTENIILFYIVPTFFSTLQLFYFGTYLPHRVEHVNKYHSGTQKRNHLWAFISCYFFGYHYEHHASPGTPWWRLYQLKEKFEAEGRDMPSY